MSKDLLNDKRKDNAPRQSLKNSAGGITKSVFPQHPLDCLRRLATIGLRLLGRTSRSCPTAGSGQTCPDYRALLALHCSDITHRDFHGGLERAVRAELHSLCAGLINRVVARLHIVGIARS